VEFDLFRYIGIILRRKNVVITVALVMALFSVFQYLKGEKFYSAHARLLFKPEEKQIIGDQMYRYSGDREKAFNTHLECPGRTPSLPWYRRISAKVGIGGTMSPSIAQARPTAKERYHRASYKHGNADVARRQRAMRPISAIVESHPGDHAVAVQIEQPIKKLRKNDEKESAQRSKEEHRMVNF
jgi:hypothetical protein